MPSHVDASRLKQFGSYGHLKKWLRKRGQSAHIGTLRKQYDIYPLVRQNPRRAADYAKTLPVPLRKDLSTFYSSMAPLPVYVREKLLPACELRCCPYCGIPTNVTTDHYLPKEHFPQYAMLSANLVPACSKCQSPSAKGQWYPGFKQPSLGALSKKGRLGTLRLLHPYFDDFLRNTVIHYEFDPSEKPFRVRISVDKRLEKRDAALLKFHIEKMKLHDRVPGVVSKLWEKLARRISGNPRYATREGLIQHLREMYAGAYESTLAINGYSFTFYRSILRSRQLQQALMTLAASPAHRKGLLEIPKAGRIRL